jgi:hypothetical protein
MIRRDKDVEAAQPWPARVVPAQKALRWPADYKFAGLRLARKALVLPECRPTTAQVGAQAAPASVIPVK